MHENSPGPDAVQGGIEMMNAPPPVLNANATCLLRDEKAVNYTAHVAKTGLVKK